jgi:hypothetical protein
MGLPKGSLLPIGLVSLFQQSRSVDPEIRDVPSLAQRPAQLDGITILCPILDRGPEGYAVSHASHALGIFRGLGMNKPGTTEKAKGQEDGRKRISIHSKIVVRTSKMGKQASTRFPCFTIS